jgi:hypothetical protein
LGILNNIAKADLIEKRCLRETRRKEKIVKTLQGCTWEEVKVKVAAMSCSGNNKEIRGWKG